MGKDSSSDVATVSKLSVLIALGYACFKIAQSALYSTAMLSDREPFLFIAGIDFSLMSALSMILSDVIVLAIVISGRMGGARIRKSSLIVSVSTALLMAIALCVGLGAFSMAPRTVAGDIAIFVYGSAILLLTLAWCDLFARLDAAQSMRSLAVSMFIASSGTLLLQAVSGIAYSVLITGVLLANALFFLFAAHMFHADPIRDRPSKAHVKPYRNGLMRIGEGLLSLLALGFAVGVINGFLLAGGRGFTGSENASSIGSMIASSVFLLIAFLFPRANSASKAYQVLFPILTAMLLAWPFMDFQYSYFFSIAFVAGHNFVSIAVMYLIIRESSDRELDPYLFMGVSILLIRASSAAGIIAGAIVSGLNIDESLRAILVVAGLIYLLSLVLLFMLRGRQRSIDAQIDQASDEGFADKVKLVATSFGLTEREEDVLLYLARGRTVPVISQNLFLSENTVRSHIKSIYVKMGVHSKQEVIDRFFRDSNRDSNGQ